MLVKIRHLGILVSFLCLLLCLIRKQGDSRSCIFRTYQIQLRSVLYQVLSGSQVEEPPVLQLMPRTVATERLKEKKKGKKSKLSIATKNHRASRGKRQIPQLGTAF